MILPIGARGIITPGLGFIHPYPATGPFGGHATLGTNLITALEFNETSGTTLYDSHGDNDATVTNATINQTGLLGKAVLLDATNEYLTVANESQFDFERNNAFSIETAFYLNSKNATKIIVCKQETSGTFRGYICYIDTANKINFELITTVVGGNKMVAITGSNVLDTGAWYHLVITYSGNSLASGAKIYLNSTSDSSISVRVNTLDNTILTNQSVIIGNRGGGFNFNGLINHMRFWGKEVSSSEVSSLYNSGNLLAY